MSENVIACLIYLKMKAGFYQFSPEFGEIKKKCKKTVDAIEAADVNLIVLPELFNTGYQFISKKRQKNFQKKSLQDIQRRRSKMLQGKRRYILLQAYLKKAKGNSTTLQY